jgi:hypothetical protein
MFGKQKIPAVFIDLLVEAQATMVRKTPMYNRAESAYKWYAEHFPKETHNTYVRIQARMEEIEQCKQAAHAIAELMKEYG